MENRPSQLYFLQPIKGDITMTAIIFDFNRHKQKIFEQKQSQKEQIIFECQQDILNTEEQIRLLSQQIIALRSEIENNYRLIAKINQNWAANCSDSIWQSMDNRV